MASAFILLFAVTFIAISNGMADNQTCYNMFEYEYHVLQKLVQLEQDRLNMLGTIGGLQDIISSLTTTSPENSRKIGNTYIRWGRTTCPSDRGAELVYRGQAAGGHYTHPGGGNQYLCLPNDPTWNEYVDGIQTPRNYIYGAEYEVADGPLSSLYQQDVPCAVCRIPRTIILMIPGRNECYRDWTIEYEGYLMSEYYNHPSNRDYACMDSDPEGFAGTETNLNGALFHHVEARCGSLHCPPYVDGRELTCAVCSYSPTD